MAMRSTEEILKSLRPQPQKTIDGDPSDEEDYAEEQENSETEEECNDFDNSEESNEEGTEPEQEDQSTSSERKSFVYGRNKYKWSLSPRETHGRRLVHDDHIHLPGAALEAVNIRSPLAAWSLLFTEDMLKSILLHTNNQIIFSTEHMHKETYNGETDIIELKAFIGLLYFNGVNQQSHVDIEELWSTEFGSNFCVAVMSFRRFKFLSVNMRFESRETRTKRTANDRLAPIRQLWDAFIGYCSRYYTMSQCAIIDEQLLGFRGRFGAKVHIKSKPARCGIKIICLNDAKTNYLYNAIPYTGQVVTQGEQVSEYYVRVLCGPLYYTNRCITFDKWFTTINIIDKLHNEFGLSAVGCIRKNKREIPSSLLYPVSVGTTRYAYDDTKTLMSFCPRKDKVVLLVSTFHRKGKTDTNGKPEMINFYNSTKSGVDTFDQMITQYTVSRKSNRWPMRLFFGMLDQGGLNAHILYNCIAENTFLYRVQFLKQLTLQLTRPHLERRASLTSLQKNIRINLRHMLDIDEVQPATDHLPKRKRCFYCTSTDDRKTSYCCIHCGKAVCDKHRRSVCVHCL